MSVERGKKKKEGSKENRDLDQKEGEKERAKPFTVSDFLETKFGLVLLKRLDVSFQEKNKQYLVKGNINSLHRYMRALVRLYTAWAQSSPLCGNKRNRPYTLLKEIEMASRVQKSRPPKESMPSDAIILPPISSSVRPPRNIRQGESLGSLLENTTYDSQSFSMLDTTQTDAEDTNQTNLESLSEILDISEESSTDIQSTRKFQQKTTRQR